MYFFANFVTVQNFKNDLPGNGKSIILKKPIAAEKIKRRGQSGAEMR